MNPKTSLVYTLSFMTLDEKVKYLKEDGTLTQDRAEAKIFKTKSQAERHSAKQDRYFYANGHKPPEPFSIKL